MLEEQRLALPRNHAFPNLTRIEAWSLQYCVAYIVVVCLFSLTEVLMKIKICIQSSGPLSAKESTGQCWLSDPPTNLGVADGERCPTLVQIKLPCSTKISWLASNAPLKDYLKEKCLARSSG